MDAGLSYLRSEAAGAVRTALVSAENLQLSLVAGLRQEEQALTVSKGGPEEAHRARYCKISHSTLVRVH